jgi:hypothetical protein
MNFTKCGSFHLLGYEHRFTRTITATIHASYRPSIHAPKPTGIRLDDLETLPVGPSYRAPLPRSSLVTKLIYSGSRVNFGSEDPYGLSAYNTSGAIRVKAP